MATSRTDVFWGLWRRARRLLAPLARDPARAAVMLDVDGTLAPIVARPELAEVPEDVRVELRRLVGRYGLVACISGRAGAGAYRLRGGGRGAPGGGPGARVAPPGAA